VIRKRYLVLCGRIRVLRIALTAAGVLLCVTTGANVAWSADESVHAEDTAEFDAFGDEFGRDAHDGGGRARDPLQGYNRLMHGFNHTTYRWVFRPVARGYRKVVPRQARVALGRAFGNLGFPVRFVNSVLQFKIKKSGIEAGRFLINTTVGVVGLFDPADQWFDWRASPEDFGQTLGYYGLGGGFPIVLPLLGHNNMRDTVSLLPDWMLNPVPYFANSDATLAITVGDSVNAFSLTDDIYFKLHDEALDPYIFFRDAYKQNRNNLIAE